MRSLRSSIVSGVVAIVACTSAAPSSQPTTAVHVEPAPTPTPLPALPPIGEAPSIVDAKTPRLTTLTAVNQDVAVVVRELALKFGLQYRIDPAVHGAVNVNLRNKTLAEALAAILPAGVSYQIRDGVLTVAPARMATRIFSLDYVAISRFGSGTTVIQRRLPPADGAPGARRRAGDSGGAPVPDMDIGVGSTDIVGDVSVADVWDEIRVAVEALVFDVGEAGSLATSMAARSGGASGSAGRPSGRTASDGRRVIVNPMAGTITVSAFPERLDQVEAFIRTFENSIQRQVLVEARIVEVSLGRDAPYGIDWSAVNGAANAGALARSDRTRQASANADVTLTGGAAQIPAVLEALSTQGDVRVLSSPRASALNNQRVVFDVTTGEIVFNRSRAFVTAANGHVTPITQVNPTQVNVGIVLHIVPQIAADNTLTMHIRPVVTSVARTAQFRDADGTRFQAPVIDTRESDTMARLRSGETVIVGGLMQTRRERVRRGVPLLRDVPLLGLLFGSDHEVERKAELVVFLTPIVIASQPLAAR